MGKDRQALRVVHCPVNTAGVPWQNVEALRRHGVDAKLVVFERYRLHPEADWSLDREGGFIRRQLAQWRAFLQLLPKTDVFHFYFGLTLIPKSFQFPILRLLPQEVGAALPRARTSAAARPRSSPYSGSADAQIVGSYDAIRWVPDAHVVPPGIDLREFQPVLRAERERPLVVHAPSNRVRKGTEHVIAACRELDVDLEIVEGLHHTEARRALRAGRHRRRPAQRGLVRPVRDRGDGARQAGGDVAPRGRCRPDRERVRRRSCRSCTRPRRRSSTRCGRSWSPPRNGRGSAPRAARTWSACTTATGTPSG